MELRKMVPVDDSTCRAEKETDTDIKNRRLGSVEKGEGGMIWENSIKIYTLPCVKMSSLSLMSMHEAGYPKLVLCDNLEG